MAVEKYARVLLPLFLLMSTLDLMANAQSAKSYEVYYVCHAHSKFGDRHESYFSAVFELEVPIDDWTPKLHEVWDAWDSHLADMEGWTRFYPDAKAESYKRHLYRLDVGGKTNLYETECKYYAKKPDAEERFEWYKQLDVDKNGKVTAAQNYTGWTYEGDGN